MTKEELLDLLQLLSQLESWSFSTNNPPPDFIMDKIDSCTQRIRREVLK